MRLRIAFSSIMFTGLYDEESKPPLYRQDISWSNIIRLSTPPEEHAPEVFQQNHREVDIWSVGKLIVDAILSFSQRISEFGRVMQAMKGQGSS
ncbi:19500_t:CDS:2 [Funneliformis geosporum]|uniref:12964_t:CDS:1 n=1 Tax=Funneliformis geosporum TaxID=1117311 RepID=A0A9W4SD86_9GLOM|nr:12964_t:CDS:2 [Funneliformis geosporum]CAI2164915.1 19500_t:CDS:2 [Funneliformis geosporum]